LPNVTSPWTWDETNKVQIALTQGTLDSKTALEVLNWANVALLGNEVIQWRNANGTGQRSLRAVRPIARSSRHGMGNGNAHRWASVFCCWPNDGVYRAPLPMTEINKTSYYKGIPDGGNWDDAPSTPFVFNGNSLRCFAPVQVKGARDGSGNLTITWKRAYTLVWRMAGRNGCAAFRGQRKIRHRHPVRHHGESARSRPPRRSLAYSAADQVARFRFAAQSTLTIAVYQLNAVIGRGQAETSHSLRKKPCQQHPTLLIDHIAANQAQKEVTANAAFDALDKALCQLTSIAILDVDTTLTDAQMLGALSMKFTGTLTAGRTITIPAKNKIADGGKQPQRAASRFR
jgi:hypothetical protein